jgi:D-aspartate ligase
MSASTAAQLHVRQAAANTHGAFILGGGLISLGIIRSLGPRGVPITVFHDGDDDIAAHSKYVRAVRLTDGSNAELTIDAIVSEAKLEARKPVLLVAGDRSLLQACRHQEELKPHLHLLLPTIGAAETVVSKELFRVFAESHGAPVPKSWLPSSLQELLQLSQTLRYPVVIKPVQSTDWQTSAVVAQQGHIKMIIARDSAALVNHWTSLAASCGPALVQEYIDGSDSDHYSYVSYRDANGYELVGTCVQKLRLNPIHGGLSSLAVCVEDESMRRSAQNLLQQLRYVSAASVCFKRDPRTGQAFIFEVNGRLPLAHGALFANGVDVPWLMYCDALGLPCDRQSVIPGRQRWISLTHDFWAANDYMRCNELTIVDWLKSLMNVRYIVELDPHDLSVFWWFLKQKVGLIIARLKKEILSFVNH